MLARAPPPRAQYAPHRLLQFQTVYRDALCNAGIYQHTYSPGEANLFAGFLRLEEIYTHLIGRFPACCPLEEQEQAVLTQLCNKLNKFFQDGKQIKAVLEAQPQQGKQLLVANRLATNVQFAVRDWILPFMMQFADLLKVLWTLWSGLKRRQQSNEGQRRGLEQLARLVGGCAPQCPSLPCPAHHPRLTSATWTPAPAHQPALNFSLANEWL